MSADSSRAVNDFKNQMKENALVIVNETMAKKVEFLNQIVQVFKD